MRIKVNRACILCDGRKFVNLYSSYDYLTCKSYLVEKCSKCELVRTKINGKVSVSQIYPVEYYGNKGSRFGVFLEILVKYFRYQRANFIDYVVRINSKSILDCGCGRGIMLDHLKNRGWSVCGTEIDSVLVDALKSKGIDVFETDSVSSLGNKPRFKVVSLFHVLEHLSNPKVELGYIYNLLEDDGLLVVEVPNLGSFQAKISRGKWFHLDVPRHISHFELKTLKALVESTGFEICSITTHSWEYGYFGLLQSLQNILSSDGQSNAFYNNLHVNKGKSINNRKNLVFGLILSFILLPIVFVLESIFSLVGRGGALRLVAKKREIK